MQAKFQNAIMLLGGLSARFIEWERTLSPEEARLRIEEALMRLSDEEFQMVRDLIMLIQTEPGRRVFGEIETSGMERTLESLATKRLPVN
jgi:hypothetical protein